MRTRDMDGLMRKETTMEQGSEGFPLTSSGYQRLQNGTYTPQDDFDSVRISQRSIMSYAVFPSGVPEFSRR